MTFERSTVFVLLRPRCPTAITWFVVSVVVDAIKRQSDRLFTHVCEKILKAVAPAITHFDAATSVVGKLFYVRVVAPSFHFRPRAKCSAPAARSVAVSEVYFTGRFNAETSAGLRVSVPQVRCASGCFDAADATAPPEKKNGAAGSSGSVRDTENGKAAETLACDIYEFGHGDLRERLACQVVTGPGKVRSPRLIVT